MVSTFLHVTSKLYWHYVSTQLTATLPREVTQPSDHPSWHLASNLSGLHIYIEELVMYMHAESATFLIILQGSICIEYLYCQCVSGVVYRMCTVCHYVKTLF